MYHSFHRGTPRGPVWPAGTARHHPEQSRSALWQLMSHLRWMDASTSVLTCQLEGLGSSHMASMLHHKEHG